MINMDIFGITIFAILSFGALYTVLKPKEIMQKQIIHINYLPCKKYPNHSKSTIIDDIPDYTSLHAEHYKLIESEKMFSEQYFWYEFNSHIDYGDNLTNGDLLLFYKTKRVNKESTIYLIKDGDKHKIVQIEFDFIHKLYVMKDKLSVINIYENELSTIQDSLVGFAVKAERYL